jgi:hypothetical protein
MGGVWGAAGGGGGIDMTSSKIGQTIIGEAMQDCVNKLGEILNQQATSMKKAVREVEARVADVSGSTLVMSTGANNGVNVGETLEILKILLELRDPVIKEVLDTVTQKTGEMAITSVHDMMATGNYVATTAGAGFIARQETPGSPLTRIHLAVVLLLACAAVANANRTRLCPSIRSIIRPS